MNGDPKEGKARRLDVGFGQNVGPQMNLFVFVVIPVSLQKYHKQKLKQQQEHFLDIWRLFWPLAQ